METLADFLCVQCNKCEANKNMKIYLNSVVEGKNWLEQQWKAWMHKAEELESMCNEKDEWIQELQTGKDWLEQQYNSWKQRAKELEAGYPQMDDSDSQCPKEAVL